MAVSRVTLFFLIGLLCMECCYTASKCLEAKYRQKVSQLPRNFDNRLTEEMLLIPKKRPFCNAFTGCGRKRSQAAPGMPTQEILRPRQFVNEESLSSLLDSINAIGDLFRQVELQTKHWGSFQDEMVRQKQDDMAYNN